MRGAAERARELLRAGYRPPTETDDQPPLIDEEEDEIDGELEVIVEEEG